MAMGTAASATTVAFFNVEVTESSFTPLPVPNAPGATLPALGDTGTVSITLPGITTANTTPFGDPDSAPNAGSVLAEITIGSLSAALAPGFGSVTFASDTSLRFSNGTFSGIAVSFPRDPGATPTYAGSFTVTTAADGATPTTFGEVAAALLDPTATVQFSFNGTTFDGIDTSFRAVSIAPIPLPAGGVLLMTALVGAWGLKRRQGTA